MEKQSILAVLSESSNRMSPKNILLCTYISTLLRYYQRSILLQQLEASTENYSQTIHRELDFGSLNFNGMYSMNSVAQGSGNHAKEEVE